MRSIRQERRIQGQISLRGLTRHRQRGTPWRFCTILIAVSACGGSSDPSNGSAFTITISSGTTPTFSWPTGVAPVIDLVVSESGGTQRYMWAIRGAAIPPPVVYGTLPPNTGNGFQCFPSTNPCAGNAAPLQQGASYTITVFRQDGDEVRKTFVP